MRHTSKKVAPNCKKIISFFGDDTDGNIRIGVLTDYTLNHTYWSKIQISSTTGIYMWVVGDDRYIIRKYNGLLYQPLKNKKRHSSKKAKNKASIKKKAKT